MADKNKLEQMLEHLVNDDQQKAEELFHEYVVAKSREIYESLIDSELEEATDEEDEEEVEEAAKDDDAEEDKVDEASEEDEDEEKMDEEFEDIDALEGGDEMGGDPTDDLEGDLEMGDEEGEDEEGEKSEEELFQDLDAIVDELQAKFDELKGGDEGEMDMGDEEETMKDDFDQLETVREYVEKVAPAKMGDNGANTKSAVAGKNDMGGTTANIAKSFSTTSGGTQGGLLKPTTAAQDGGNVNVPGAKNATKLSPVKGGHGAEKKGSSETAPDKKSLIGSRK